jgi:hypothetical protein
VEPLTRTVVAIVSSLTPASAASKICARFTLRAADCDKPLGEFRSAAAAYRKLHR